MANERADFTQIDVEAETAFGVLNAGPAWIGLPCWDNNDDGLERTLYPEGAYRTDRGEHEKVIGPQNASTFNFKTYFTGMGQPYTPAWGAGSTKIAVQTPLGCLLKAALGSETLDTGTLVLAASSATAVNVADEALITADAIVGVKFLAGSNGTVWRHVESKTAGPPTDILNLSYGLPGSPAADDIVYATASYKMVLDPSASSLQFRRLKENQESGYHAFGCKPDVVGIEKLKGGELMILSFANKVASYDDTITGVPVTPTLPTKVPWMDAQLELIPYDPATGLIISTYSATYKMRCKSFDLSFKNSLIADPDCHAVSGVGAWLCQGEPSLEINMTLAPGRAMRDALTIGKHWAMILTNGRLPGRTAGIFARKVMLIAEPKHTKDGGLAATQCKFGLKCGALDPSIVFFQG
jgi:hypothetical protein